MPIYDYKCLACGFEFERRVFYRERDGVHCMKCRFAAERLVSAPGKFPVGKYGKGGGLK
jgi:putative FmdB family regulatory protein